MGYRYYDSTDTPVLFPFGFGLSYTTFRYSDIAVSEKEVSFDIENTGDVKGKEIAQVYIGREAGSVYRVKKELKGFTKVSLEPGEKKHIIVPLDDKAFRYYDVNTLNWVVEPGTYTVYVASSVADVRLKKTIDIGPCISSIPSFYSGDIRNVSDEEYEKLYGTALTEEKDTGLIGRNDSISSLKHSKSLVGKVVVSYLNFKYKTCRKDLKKKADLAGILDMPIRAVSKLTGGTMNSKMVDSIVDVANGHPVKGWSAFFDEKKKLTKDNPQNK